MFYFTRTSEGLEDQEYDSNQLDILLCNPHGIFGALSYREVNEYSRFWAIGSGDEYALGAMHAVYDQLDDPAQIARIGVAAACEFATGCGAPIHVQSVDLLGG